MSAPHSGDQQTKTRRQQSIFLHPLVSYILITNTSNLRGSRSRPRLPVTLPPTVTPGTVTHTESSQNRSYQHIQPRNTQVYLMVFLGCLYPALLRHILPPPYVKMTIESFKYSIKLLLNITILQSKCTTHLGFNPRICQYN